MEIKEQIRELKAQAYDLLAMIEQWKARLGQVNQQIVGLSQKEKEEASKPKKPVSGKKDKGKV